MTIIAPFKLERCFAEYEFKVRYLLSSSDCESLKLPELLALADPETLDRWERLSLGYTESQGDPLLRAEIAAHYSGLGPDDVIVLVPEEGIYLAMHTLVQPGDHVVAVFPAYQSLYEIVRARGCRLTTWPVTPTADGQAWTLDLDALAAAITPQTRLLVVNFPHNPTGHVPTRAEFDAIVELARRHDLYLFSDEMYRGLELDPAARLPAAATVYPKAVSLAGLSKTHAAPGLRLGWLASRAPGQMAAWLALKDYTTICHSAPSEVLGLMALRAQAHLLQRNLGLIRENVAAVAALFARRPDLFAWAPPKGGSIAFPEWRGPGTVDALCQGLLDAHGAMLLPGSIFDMPGPRFRLGLGRAHFAEALERLERYAATR